MMEDGGDVVECGIIDANMEKRQVLEVWIGADDGGEESTGLHIDEVGNLVQELRCQGDFDRWVDLRTLFMSTLVR